MSDPFDVQHRDCYDSLAAMRDAGGADLILTSPPYPDARKAEAYGAEFDTSLAGYQRLGDATFEALKPGGVCALNIDGPVRKWRGEDIGSERSLIAFEVALDWAKRVGFRYVDHYAYLRDGAPFAPGVRWRKAWEPVLILARPGGEVQFDNRGLQRSAKRAGRSVGGGKLRSSDGKVSTPSRIQGDWAQLTNAEYWPLGQQSAEHEAPFADEFADAFVLCYSPPGGIIGDPFAGSGTVPFAVHRAGDGRRFIGGDLGIRKMHNGRECGRRWADIINDGLRQGRLFG